MATIFVTANHPGAPPWHAIALNLATISSAKAIACSARALCPRPTGPDVEGGPPRATESVPGAGRRAALLREKSVLTTAQVLDIFRQKTAPAFEVALRFGAICAGLMNPRTVAALLQRSVGCGLSIRDDLEDGICADEGSSRESRASILTSLIWDHARVTRGGGWIRPGNAHR